MALRRPSSTSQTTGADSTKAVDEFMRTLDHPFKPLIQAIRVAILAADPAIAEGVKWNAPSFRTTEYFATMNLRQKNGIAVILHLGAKARELPAGGVGIADQSKMLKWLGKDRAMILFESVDDLNARKRAFEAIVRQWIAHV